MGFSTRTMRRPRPECRSRRSAITGSFLIAAMLLVSVAACAQTQIPATDPRGLYVYSWGFVIQGSPDASPAQALTESLNGVDGITLVENWSSIEPERGVFQWNLASGPSSTWTDGTTYVTGDEVVFNSQVYVSQVDNNVGNQPKPLCAGDKCAWLPAGTSAPDLLDQWIRKAIFANKKIILAVRAGQDTPCWLFTSDTQQCGANYSGTYAGATRLQLLASAHQGMGKCEGVTMAPPWDSAFLSEWDNMLAALAAHLKATPSSNPQYSLYDFVTVVRITGLNRTTDEFRVVLASQLFPGTLGVEFENLHFMPDALPPTPSPASPTVVEYAEQFGTIPGFQTNDYFAPSPGGASCWPLGEQRRCFPEWYEAMLETGISPRLSAKHPDPNLRSQLIEIFIPDIEDPAHECTPFSPPAGLTGTELQQAAPGPGCGYAHEIAQASADLINPPMVTISFPSASQTTHWFTQLPLVGEVSASSAVGETISLLHCTGAASGSGPGGFALNVQVQGNPAKVRCVATDAAGHRSESIRALWIDTDPPVTAANVTVSRLGAAHVTLAASDAVSGVAETRYRINSGPWTPGTDIELVVDGTYKIDYRSTDVAGNVENVQSVTVSVAITSPCKGTKCI